MIMRDGFTVNAFLSAISCTIARDAHARIDAEAVEPGDEIAYLAAGYWRARLVWDEADPARLLGVCLINPDRTPVECTAVERGIAVLLHTTYTP